MPPPHNPNDDLEKFIHNTLRSLPERRAPASLETRVLSELARRPNLPWWRQSFVHWPMSVRVAFLVFSAGVAAFAITFVLDVLRGPGAEALSRGASHLHALRTAATHIVATITTLLPAVSVLWFYAGLAAIVASYAALFGAGAVAYRCFWKNR